MNRIARTAAAILLAAPILAACGGTSEPASAPEMTLTEMCVVETLALYDRHELPLSAPAQERPQLCTEWMAERGITTKAQLVIEFREADKMMRDLKK